MYISLIYIQIYVLSHTITFAKLFSRGKPSGHDVDFLLTHPEAGSEVGLLPQLLQRLQETGFILIGQTEKNTFTHGVLKTDFKLSIKGQLDHFEKWIGIMKLPKAFKDKHIDSKGMVVSSRGGHPPVSGSLDDQPPSKKARCDRVDEQTPWCVSIDRDWCARRVDLIISPFSQYYYALVGWTGSKHFNRDLRTYAQKKLKMKVTSHGIYDFTKVGFVSQYLKKYFEIHCRSNSIIYMYIYHK